MSDWLTPPRDSWGDGHELLDDATDQIPLDATSGQEDADGDGIPDGIQTLFSAADLLDTDGDGLPGVIYFEATRYNDRMNTSIAHTATIAEGSTPYMLVFFNACAGAEANNPQPRMFKDAFKARNYISYDKPGWVEDAKENGVKFFDRLNGGRKISSAIVNLKCVVVDPHTHQQLGGGMNSRTALIQVGKTEADDAVIIDQTP